eukprot:2051683-Alexandrium_andersonii.AAC.1
MSVAWAATCCVGGHFRILAFAPLRLRCCLCCSCLRGGVPHAVPHGDGRAAVSYTHLTLPTICSV